MKTIKNDNHVLEFVQTNIIGTPLYGWVLTTQHHRTVESNFYTTKPAAMRNCVDVLGKALLDPYLLVEDEDAKTKGLLASAVRNRFSNNEDATANVGKVNF